MRIAFDARWYNDSGVGTYVAGLVGAMVGDDADKDVELFIYEDPKNPVPNLAHLPVRRIPVRSPRYSVRAQVELAGRCRADKIDVFHSPFYVLPVAAPCPVIVTVHDVIPFLFSIYPPLKQLLVKTAYRAAAHRATHVITDSEATARDVETFLKVPPGRISTVHLAVSRKDFHPNPYDDELNYAQKKYGITLPYVVVASPRNWRTKNLATALNALVLAQKQSAFSFQTVIYGPRAEGAALANTGRTLHVVQTGFIPAEDLGILFRHAAAFIFPSLYEGFGLPLLEAMSCGCPVVTSNGGSLGEIAGEGAQVFDPMDAAGMAKAVIELLADPGRRKRWRSRALTRATDFSWEKAVEQTNAVYRQVANQSPYQRPLNMGSRNAA